MRHPPYAPGWRTSFVCVRVILTGVHTSFYFSLVLNLQVKLNCLLENQETACIANSKQSFNKNQCVSINFI